MTPLISILLPTIRPDLCRLRLQEYAGLALAEQLEVVVVSDSPKWDVSQPNPEMTVQHVHQPRGGNIPATNLAFERATGTYVCATNDEVAFEHGFFMAMVNTAMAHGAGLFSGTQTPYCSNDYFGVFFANCPFGRKDFFQRLNGGNWLFDPVYHAFYADPDLALRAHAKGFPVVKVPAAQCVHHCVRDADGHLFNRETYYHLDRRTFAHRWAHLGPMEKDPSARRIAS